jgi:hypothetical protein
MLLVSACGSYSVSNPGPAQGPRASFATAGPTSLLGLSSGPVGYRAANDPALEAWKARELARVSREKELGAGTFDSLRARRDRRERRPAPTSAPVVLCRPLPYDAQVKVVGPEGGQLQVGPHTVRIPRGALTQHYVITAELPVSEAVSVRLSPHGLRFVRMPVLTLSYAHCNPSPDTDWRIASTDEFLRVTEYPRSVDKKRSASAWLESTARYAVATGERGSN